jgi:hypothetical protein
MLFFASLYHPQVDVLTVAQSPLIGTSVYSKLANLFFFTLSWRKQVCFVFYPLA